MRLTNLLFLCSAASALVLASALERSTTFSIALELLYKIYTFDKLFDFTQSQFEVYPHDIIFAVL